MGRNRSLGWILVLVLGVCLGVADLWAQSAQQAPAQARKAAPASKPGKSPSKAAAPAGKPVIEPKAIDILRASSNRLAAAQTMAFTAVVSYESSSRYGPPLVYMTKSDVTMQRPDKLRVITFGDGPASELYYNGRTIVAYSPAENLVAVAQAPPTIDAALKFAYRSAAIYYPFSDLIESDPFKGIADGMEFAFYIGQSKVVGGTTTDMVAYGTGGVFVQAWIGAEDKLPRMVRAVYRDDPGQLRHQMELSNWQLDGAVPTELFASEKAAAGTPIAFMHPNAKPAPGARPPATGKTSKTPPPKTQ
jgi:hypothetical protein